MVRYCSMQSSLFSLFINTYLARLLPKIEVVVLMIHVVGFVCIIVPLVYLAPHSSAKDVFASFNNGGDWNTEALAFFVGIPTTMFAFIGTSKIETMQDTGTDRLQERMQLLIWVSDDLSNNSRP